MPRQREARASSSSYQMRLREAEPPAEELKVLGEVDPASAVLGRAKCGR